MRTTFDLVVFLVAAFAYVIGVCIIIPELRDRERLAKGSPDPREVTLTALAAETEPGNTHVQVTGYTLGTPLHHVESGIRHEWKFVVIPAMGAEGAKLKRPVIIRSFSSRTADQLKEFTGQTRLTALVNLDPSFTQAITDRYRQTFPNEKIESALVLDEGMAFPDRAAHQRMLGLGTGLMFLGVVSILGLICLERKPSSASTSEPQAQIQVPHTQ